MSDEIIPHSFRSTVQQLVSDCDRHASSAASSGIVSGLLNRVESTLSIVEEGFNLLSASPLFSAECTLLSTFRSSLVRCVRTLQYGQNDCTVRPVFIPSYTLSYSGYRGRPSILLNLEKVELLRSSGYAWNEIATSLQVSRTTLWRRIREGGRLCCAIGFLKQTAHRIDFIKIKSIFIHAVP